jgi:hypothetical protein
MYRRVFLQTMITLASAALGIVAALAWNEAIQATILAVVVLVALGRAAARVGGEAAITP